MRTPLRRYLMALAAGAGVALASNAFAAGPAASEFRAMDANHDGKISRDEHAAAAKGMFATMDANKDGRVTPAEMDAAHERVTGQKAKAGDMRAADKIKVIDKDGDGVLTADEHAAGARSMFDAMDTDKDAALTEAELAAGHAKMPNPPKK